MGAGQMNSNWKSKILNPLNYLQGLYFNTVIGYKLIKIMRKGKRKIMLNF